MAATPKDPPGTTYVFTAKTAPPDATIVNYVIPAIPPGPYAVSLFAGMEPTNYDSADNLSCEVYNSTAASRVLVAVTTYTGQTATFVSGASSTRVIADSVLEVTCSAERGPFTYNSDPLRVTFTRLAKLTAQPLVPNYVS